MNYRTMYCVRGPYLFCPYIPGGSEPPSRDLALLCIATTCPQLQHYRFESSLQRTVLAPIFIVWAIAEVHRFYLGYKGNIKEMVISINRSIFTADVVICMRRLQDHKQGQAAHRGHDEQTTTITVVWVVNICREKQEGQATHYRTPKYIPRTMHFFRLY